MALAPGVLPLGDDRFAAREHRLHPAGDPPALVRRVVDVHVVGLGGDDLLGVRVVDDDVGVRAGRDGALLRVQAEHPGRGGAGDLDPAAAADVPVDDGLVEQVHAVLDARHPVGDPGEVAPAQLLLAAEAEGAVVGGDHLEVVGAQAPPQRRLVLLGPERGAAHVLGALEVRLGEVVGGQEQVLRAGLPEDGQALVAGPGQLGDRLRRRDVHDVQRRPGDLGEPDGAVGRLRLQEGLADLAVEAGVGLAAGEGLLDEDVDRDAVLGVHHDQAAVLGGALHGAQDLSVVGVEDAGVRHELLEGGHPLLHQQVHLLERLLVHVGDDHVEAVVDGAVALGLGVPGVQALAQGVPDALDGEVDDGGRAAPGGGAGAGLEGVGGVGAAEGHLHVGVPVDAARNDVLAARVDDVLGGERLGRRGAGRGEGGDAAVLDQDVGVDLVGRGDDEATADDGTAAHAAVPSCQGPRWGQGAVSGE